MNTSHSRVDSHDANPRKCPIARLCKGWTAGMVQIVMVGFPQRHNAFRKGPPVRTESPKISIGNFEKRARNACCDSTCEIACVCVCVWEAAASEARSA